MAELTALVLAVVRLVVLGLGIAITYYSYVAYRRTQARYLRDASLGFAIISVGVFIEGVLFELVGLELAVVHIIESIAIGVGFLILLQSLHR